MNQRRFQSCLFCLALVALGCGDSPYRIRRDSITAYNEMCDAVSKIPDDETAEQVAEGIQRDYMVPLKDKFESIKKRFDTLQKATTSKKEKEEAEAAMKELDKEKELVITRYLKHFGPSGRLQQIRAKLVQAEEARTGKRVDLEKSFPALTKCIKRDGSSGGGGQGNQPVITFPGDKQGGF
ncbi:MAG: hypothetical protein L0Z62_06015 [Gemmataceae bacterium]|nr:hypothetical protein [Gemmataceae bacterium]